MCCVRRLWWVASCWCRLRYNFGTIYTVCFFAGACTCRMLLVMPAFLLSLGFRFKFVSFTSWLGIFPFLPTISCSRDTASGFPSMYCFCCHNVLLNFEHRQGGEITPDCFAEQECIELSWQVVQSHLIPEWHNGEVECSLCETCFFHLILQGGNSRSLPLLLELTLQW